MRALDRGPVTIHLVASSLLRNVYLLAPPSVTSPQSGSQTDSLMNEDMLTAVCSARLVRRGQREDQPRPVRDMTVSVITQNGGLQMYRDILHASVIQT